MLLNRPTLFNNAAGNIVAISVALILVLAASAHAAVNLEIARAYYESHEYENALIELKKQENSPGLSDNDLHEVHKFYALIHVANKQKEKGIQAFEVALQYNPSLQIEPKYQSQEAIEALNIAKSRITDGTEEKSENKSPNELYDSLRKALYYLIKALFH